NGHATIEILTLATNGPANLCQRGYLALKLPVKFADGRQKVRSGTKKSLTDLQQGIDFGVAVGPTCPNAVEVRPAFWVSDGIKIDFDQFGIRGRAFQIGSAIGMGGALCICTCA